MTTPPLHELKRRKQALTNLNVGLRCLMVLFFIAGVALCRGGFAFLARPEGDHFLATTRSGQTVIVDTQSYHWAYTADILGGITLIAVIGVALFTEFLKWQIKKQERLL